MGLRFLMLSVTILTIGLAATTVLAVKPEDHRETREHGRMIYERSCLFCHGAAGKGDGPAGATIMGRVIFRGAVPPPQVVEVTRNPETCGASQSIQPMIVDPASGGVKDTVVSRVLQDRPVMPATDQPSIIPTVTNRTCAFHPRVGMAKMGDLLETRNEDPVMHNTHIFADNRTFLNVALVA